MQICSWAISDIMLDYHNNEFGKIVETNQELFERLSLEIMQAGLKWETVLLKKEGLRKAFSNFDYEKVKKYNEKNILELLNNRNIIRNKLKINSIINNANIFSEKDMVSYIYNYKISTSSKEDIMKLVKDLKKWDLNF